MERREAADSWIWTWIMPVLLFNPGRRNLHAWSYLPLDYIMRRARASSGLLSSRCGWQAWWRDARGSPAWLLKGLMRQRRLPNIVPCTPPQRTTRSGPRSAASSPMKVCSWTSAPMSTTAGWCWLDWWTTMRSATGPKSLHDWSVEFVRSTTKLKWPTSTASKQPPMAWSSQLNWRSSC